MTQLQMAAMGTDCLLILHGPEDGAGEEALARAAERVHEYEERFSRFRPDSELSRLNEAPQEQVPVGAELGGLLARSLEYARVSGGIFDPVVLDDLLALGYDRTFDEVRARSHKGAVVAQAPRFRWRDMLVDAKRQVVTRPRGARIDLGGIAKGAAADVAIAELSSYPGALVDLGGDIRVRGRPADADFWIIEVEDGQSHDGALGYIRLRNGAVATSSLRKRRWVHDGETVHHMIDPRSGQPARSGVLQCSVIADTTEHAEVAAKVGFIRGPGFLHERSELGKALGVRGIAWLTLDGTYRRTSGWRKHELDC